LRYICCLRGHRHFKRTIQTRIRTKPPTPENQHPATKRRSLFPNIKSAPTDEGQLATVNNAKIPSYAKVYVAPIPGGFENYIIAGLRNKKVPLTVVIDRTKADYEISGVSDSEKAGWAKMLFIGSQNSNEQASIKISDLKTGAVIFGYSVHKTNSARGKQSAGEACAKHIKQIVLK
jgi:hypothetical protein